jgi:hypothetical protein
MLLALSSFGKYLILYAFSDSQNNQGTAYICPSIAEKTKFPHSSPWLKPSAFCG